MTWVQTLLLLLVVFGSVKSKTIECMRCVGGDYELTNMFLANSKLQRKLDRLDETAKSNNCFDTTVGMVPCDGYCVNVVVLDEREQNVKNKIVVSGMIAGCSTDLIPVLRPRKPVINGDDMIRSGFEVVEGTHEYTFKLVKKEKNEPKKDPKKEEAEKKKKLAREDQLRVEYQLNDYEAQIATYICSLLFVVLMVTVMIARYKRHVDQQRLAAVNLENSRAPAKNCQKYQKL